MQQVNPIIKDVVQPINSIITSSVFGVAVLDFLSPKGPYLQYAGYGMAGLLLVGYSLDRYFKWKREQPRDGVYKPSYIATTPRRNLLTSPGWVIATAITVLVLVLGQASKAKAAEGGLIASAIPAVANVQADWLDVRRDNQEIKQSLAKVEQKLEAIQIAAAPVPKDAQEQLVAKGYKLTDGSLVQALEAKDMNALKLFSDVGFHATGPEPMGDLLEAVLRKPSLYGQINPAPFLPENANWSCKTMKGPAIETDVVNGAEQVTPALKLWVDMCGKEVVTGVYESRVKSAQGFQETADPATKKLLDETISNNKTVLNLLNRL